MLYPYEKNQKNEEDSQKSIFYETGKSFFLNINTKDKLNNENNDNPNRESTDQKPSGIFPMMDGFTEQNLSENFSVKAQFDPSEKNENNGKISKIGSLPPSKIEGNSGIETTILVNDMLKMGFNEENKKSRNQRYSNIEKNQSYNNIKYKSEDKQSSRNNEYLLKINNVNNDYYDDVQIKKKYKIVKEYDKNKNNNENIPSNNNNNLKNFGGRNNSAMKNLNINRGNNIGFNMNNLNGNNSAMKNLNINGGNNIGFEEFKYKWRK